MILCTWRIRQLWNQVGGEKLTATTAGPGLWHHAHRNYWRSKMESVLLVAEVRTVREQLAACLGFRLHDIVKEAQRQDAAGDKKVCRLPPRRPIAGSAVTHEPEASNPADSR